MLDEKIESFASEIVDASFTVHSELGPGLLEKVYELCLIEELRARGLHCQRQVPVPIKYRDLTLEYPFRIDILVENLIICEVKAVDRLLPIHQAQLMTYLKLAKKPLGFLINFNVSLFKSGIKRIIISKQL